MASFHLSIKSGKRGSAAEHAAYIGRSGKYGKKNQEEDLLALEHGNLPAWANNDPNVLWRSADKYERVNGSTYVELVLALPNELSLKQNQELMREFIKKEIGSKPYQAAIHAPTAALGGVPQPHLHVMTSSRIPDGIQRSPQQHFARFNRENPSNGGCQKADCGKDRKELKAGMLALRQGWAELQNAHLKKNGFEATVDWRSLKEQGVDRKAEVHLGKRKILKMTAEERSLHLERRNNPDSI